MAKRGRPSLNLSAEEKQTRMRQQLAKSQQKSRAQKRASRSPRLENQPRTFNENSVSISSCQKVQSSPNWQWHTFNMADMAASNQRHGLSSMKTSMDTAAEIAAVSDSLPASNATNPDIIPRTDADTLNRKTEQCEEPRERPDQFEGFSSISGGSMHSLSPGFLDFPEQYDIVTWCPNLKPGPINHEPPLIEPDEWLFSEDYLPLDIFGNEDSFVLSPWSF